MAIARGLFLVYEVNAVVIPEQSDFRPVEELISEIRSWEGKHEIGLVDLITDTGVSIRIHEANEVAIVATGKVALERYLDLLVEYLHLDLEITRQVFQHQGKHVLVSTESEILGCFKSLDEFAKKVPTEAIDF